MSQNAGQTSADSVVDAMRPYKKAVVGISAVVAFVCMAATVRKRAGNGRLFEQATQHGRGVSPRVGAYIFATQTFIAASTLVGSGALAISMGVATALNVNSIQEFSDVVREKVHQRFPELRRSSDENSPENIQSTKDFFSELAYELEKEEKEGPWSESAAHSIIGSRVRHELGLGPRK
ncbi:hypothetical protein HK105_200964 [Polyrhizophydium stewartii]|uniref:Transmembrane protein 242 n=1 Tax=Polyrhizophydium stewartii TaxID=2732419 RepID=A0ABR4NIN2_9FUNG